MVVATCQNSDRTPDSHLDEVAKKKEQGWGDPESRRKAQINVDEAKRKLCNAEAVNDRAAVADAERAPWAGRSCR